ncbi:sulfatase-like hydrolase/transferase [bacterium]|nr:sulfatase-like hydrolase/transferase [candidate division CSSED10-310 bacterium]
MRSTRFTRWLPGRSMDQHILFYHFVFIYLNSVAVILFHVRNRQYWEIVMVLALASVIASVWTLVLLTHRKLNTAGRPSGFRRIAAVAFKSILLTLLYMQLMLAAGDLFCLFTFSHKITPEVMFVLFETNLRESGEFLSMYGNLNVLLIVLVIALPFVLKCGLSRLPPCRRCVCRFFSKTYWIVNALFCLLGCAGFQAWHQQYNSTFALLSGVAHYREETAGYQQIRDNLQGSDLEGQVLSTAGGGQIGVLVIGESLNRHHMRLYGYYRPTTPRLDELADELFAFRDVISPHSHTNLVMRKLLTFYNNESTASWFAEPTLINCMNAAGYKTYWLSNQEAYGAWANVTTALASQAQVIIYNGWRTSAGNTRVKYDTDLLPCLDTILEKDGHEKKFIAMHLMGNHVLYRDRYPKEFDRFDRDTVQTDGRSFLDEEKKKTISEYDNAVLVTDYLLAAIIDRLKRLETPSYLLFLSDHGEEVYDQRDFCGHTETVGNRFMIEIPFILWLSEEYRAVFPEIAERSGASLDNPYLSDDLIHTLCELSHLDFDRFEPARSIVNPAFRRDRRRLYNGRDYDEVVRHDSSTHLVEENFHKLWAHRVNSLGKLHRAAAIFSGVELDLVFTEEDGSFYFDVNHPPVESIHLTLDAYLNAAAEVPDLRFWFDIKNLTHANRHILREHLDELIERYNLHNRIVVESCSYDCLAGLARDGVITSYYLPYLKLDQMGTQEKMEQAAELIQNTRLAAVTAISYPGYMHDFVKEYLLPQLPGIRLLTWFPDKCIDSHVDAPFLQALVNDPHIMVTLVGFPTPVDR